MAAMPSRGAAVAAAAAAAAGGSALLLAGAAILLRLHKRRNDRQAWPPSSSSAVPPSASSSAYESLIGSTPLVKLTKLSALLGGGRSVWAKMECLNPGGTGKDRAALRMVQDAESRGDLPPPLDPCGFVVAPGAAAARAGGGAETEERPASDDAGGAADDEDASYRDDVDASISLAVSRSRTGGVVVEGTSGSTGISLASLCAVRGHSAVVVMPDDQAVEKRTTLRCLGAVVHVVPNAAISNPNNYVNVARRIADEINSRYGGDDGDDDVTAGEGRGGGNDGSDAGKSRRRRVRASFIDQFENPSNYYAHLEGTGPELWSQASGRIDAFVMSSGTGGTISGVGRYLKRRRPATRVVLVDPPGSALYNKVRHGVAFAPQQSERSMLRHRYDTLAEGIGLDRVTANFARGTDGGIIDDAVRVADQEAVDMAHWLLREEGLFVGSSSAMNVVGAVRVASGLGPGCAVITVICDGGQRHLTRFWNRSFVVGEWGLEWPGDCGRERVPECIASIVAEDDA